MDILVGIQAFAEHLSLRHVLVLNLIGWMIKCIFHHRGLDNWTDIIPALLGIFGVGLAYMESTAFQGNFIVYGLANAGLAWLLHRLVKPIPNLKRVFKKK